MIPVLSNEAMRNADRRAIENYGVPSIALMESAGRAIADQAAVMMEMSPADRLDGKRILIICGPGNNGGDGFVAARHLMNRGAEVWVRLAGERDRISGDALTMLTPLEQLRTLDGRYNGQLDGLHDSELDTLSYFRFDVAIDALYGTGFSGTLRDAGKLGVELLLRLRNEHVPILAVDIPSGLSGDTGQAPSGCAGADVTVTFAAPKLGHCIEPGRTLSGNLIVHDIGIPRVILHDAASAWQPEAVDIRKMLPMLPADAHKGTRGKLFVLAGSIGLTGGAALCANAAVANGAGLVVTGTPETAEATVASKLLEAMTVPFPDHNGMISEQSASALPHWNQWADAWAVGPGIGRSDGVSAIVRLIWESVEKPVIFDADALHALAELRAQLGKLPRAAGERILTPHPGEFCALTGVDLETLARNRRELAQDFARQERVTLVLKGSPTIIVDPSGKLCFNPTGNASLATGGTGDVLTGMIGALLARQNVLRRPEPLSAALAGCWLHGAVADQWVKAGNAPAAFTASKLLTGLPDVMKTLRGATA